MANIPDILKEEVPNAVKEHEPMIVAHFSKEELTHLDQMQGGTSIDEATGLREYSKLNDLIKKPKVKKIVKELFSEYSQYKHLPNKVEKLSKDVLLDPKRFTPNPVDSVPEIRKIEQEGEHGDDEIALIPITLSDFLDSLKGGSEINPHTGLRQYGFFSNFLRIAAPIVGTIAGSFFGAPHIGAMLGSTLGGAAGGALGHAVTGGKPLQGALMGGLGGAMAPMVGSMFPGAANAVSSGVGNVLGNTAGQATATALGQAGTQAATQAVGQGVAQAAGQGVPQTFMQSMMQPGNILPLAAIGGLYAKGHQEGQENIREAEEKNRKARAALNNYYGMKKKLGSTAPFDPGYNPDFRTSAEKHGSPEHNYFTNTPGGYATGGYVIHNDKPNVKDEITPGKSFLIDGPGKGQDDHVRTQLLNGDFIVDASTTSNLGDGSSDAGSKELNHMVNLIRKYKGNGGKIRLNHKTITKKMIVPAALSKDEFKIDTSIVTLIGNGDNVKGGKILQQWVNNIRRHKTSKRNTIPPKAKPIMQYFPKNFKLKVS